VSAGVAIAALVAVPAAGDLEPVYDRLQVLLQACPALAIHVHDYWDQQPPPTRRPALGVLLVSDHPDDLEAGHRTLQDVQAGGQATVQIRWIPRAEAEQALRRPASRRRRASRSHPRVPGSWQDG
jgi:hypothetical protein